MNPHEEDRLRDLLDGAVADVEPRRGLDEITSRTRAAATTQQSHRPWYLGAAAAVVATAATIAAVAVTSNGPGTTAADPGPADGTPSEVGSPLEPTPSSEPEAEPEPPTPPTPPTVEPSQPTPSSAKPVQPAVPVYYVGETGQGPRLFREFHSPRDTVPDLLTTAVEQALSLTPDDPDYFSPWPDGANLGQADFDGEIITLDLDLEAAGAGADVGLHDRPAGMSEEAAEMAVQQLVYTAQAALQQGRPPVQFLIDGGRTDQVLGVPASEPLAHGDETSVLAQVWIIAPAEGAVVQSGFTVEGIGAFFEANATWELRQGDRVVSSGFTMAQECCRMAPYSFTVDAPPGDYTLVVKDEDMSGGEGFTPFQDTKNVTVTN